jgi:hypothetical protein
MMNNQVFNCAVVGKKTVARPQVSIADVIGVSSWTNAELMAVSVDKDTFSHAR